MMEIKTTEEIWFMCKDAVDCTQEFNQKKWVSVESLNKDVLKHRQLLTCPENCFCWKIEYMDDN